MFDWDRDYSELVEGRTSVPRLNSPEASGGPAAQSAGSDYASPPSPAPRRYFVPIVLSALILTGIAFEKADAVQLLSKGTMSGDLFGSVVAEIVAEPLPEGLIIYEVTEYRRFMAGLQGLNAAELDRLAQSARADMHRAPQSMAPYFHDALFLIQRKLDSHEG